jgi:membrane-bound lytic murein transglycosylase F
LSSYKRLIIGTLFAIPLSTCHVAPIAQNQLDRIQRNGVLNFLTREDPTTYYQSPDGYSGLEYDLANLFAAHLGVRAKFNIPDTFNELLNKIGHGKADIAAAGITITDARKQHLRFAPAYQEITEQLVYRSDHRKPSDIAALSNGIIEVVKGTSHVSTLEALKLETPELNWNINSQLDSNGLLYLVNEGLIDYTLADSNQAQLLRRFYPKLNIAFDVSEPRQLAWAFPISDDTSLYDEAVKFFNQIKQDKTLDRLIEKHYGHTNSLSYVSNCKFREHKKSRLPIYQKYFDSAANDLKLDWRLLAAIGYQESHWLQEATSPTGVQGIMMLTNDTAGQLGVKNRTDPAQSIAGGARYFQQRKQIIPETIPEPDRTWFALASYNVGPGHLEDAMQLTQRQGGNPDKWMDVKQRLPLLEQKKWHENTKYGYARGQEPVHYVENIRSYYDLLVWLTEENKIQKNALSDKAKIITKTTVAIDSPLL